MRNLLSFYRECGRESLSRSWNAANGFVGATVGAAMTALGPLSFIDIGNNVANGVLTFLVYFVTAYLLAFVLGFFFVSPFLAWKNERDARVKAERNKNSTDETRCTLSVTLPQCIPSYGSERWITKITNQGPAAALGVQMQLVDIVPPPKCDPSFRDRCPHKVNVSGLVFDALPPNLARGQTEKFEPVIIHPGGPVVPVNNMDTEHGRGLMIEIGERWHLFYRVFATNSNAVDLPLSMCRKADGSVVIEGNDHVH